MAITIVADGSNNTGTTSVDHVSVTMPGTLLDGDYLVSVVCCERATATPGVPAGLSGAWTTLDNGANTDFAWFMGGIPLTPADSGVTVTSTVSGGNTRRQAIGYTVLRGTDYAHIVTATGTYTANGTGVVTAAAPNVTPAANDCLLYSLMAACNTVTPYIRTQSVNAPYSDSGSNGFFDTSTSTTSNNAIVHGASRQISGGSGVSQSGATFNDTTSPTPTKFSWIAATLAIPPSDLWLPPVAHIRNRAAVMRSTNY